MNGNVFVDFLVSSVAMHPGASFLYKMRILGPISVGIYKVFFLVVQNDTHARHCVEKCSLKFWGKVHVVYARSE